MARHISIFMENKPGRLKSITGILYENGVNLRAISVASTGDFGVVKILVNEPEKAVEALRENRVTVSPRDIIAVVVDDRPGGLFRLLEALSEKSVNIEDCYGFVLEDKKEAVIVLETEQEPSVKSFLEERGFRLMPDEEIYGFPGH